MIEARVTRSRGGQRALLLLAGSRYAMLEGEADGSVRVLLADRSTEAEAESFGWDDHASEATLLRICDFLEPATDTDPAPPPSQEEPNA